MNKKLLYISAVCFMVSLLPLFTACELLESNSSREIGGSDGKAAVRIQIGGGIQGRTVAPVTPDLTAYEWELLGVESGGASGGPWTTLSAEGGTINIVPGEWDFTLNGYKAPDTDTIILTGKKTETISLGGTQTLTFEVAPLEDGNGTGTVKLKMTLPEEDHGITSAKVFKEDGNEYEPGSSLTPTDDNTITFTKTLSTGVYYFSIKLYKWNETTQKDDLYGVVSQIVYVWPGMDTEWNHKVEMEDLKLTYTITYHLWDGASTPGYYRRTDATLTLEPPSNYPGYYFRGWYNDTAFSNPVTEMTPSVSTGDKHFYAKLIPAQLSVPSTLPSLSSLAAALTFIQDNAEAGEAYTITLEQNEPNFAPMELSYNNAAVSVTLVGSAEERIVSLSSTGSLFTVKNGVTLSLGDKITLQGKASNTGALVTVDTGGALEMNNGSKISGNTYTYGGGVSVSGTFTMNGGDIISNTGDYCGGVYVRDTGTFTMNNGNITSNIGLVKGAGAVTTYGTFTMNNGNITSNTGTYGGAVTTYGTFTMNNGNITSNTINDNGVGGVFGGGVYVVKDGTYNGTFIKAANGVIYGSDADSTLQNKAFDTTGHAVYVVGDKLRSSTVAEGEILNSEVNGAAGGWLDHWTVTFNAGLGAFAEGTSTLVRTVNSGEQQAALWPSPDPTRENYKFGGWYTSEPGSLGSWYIPNDKETSFPTTAPTQTPFNEGDIVTANLAVQALWLFPSYSITMKPGPADPEFTATTIPILVGEGEEATFPATFPIRAGESATFTAENGYASPSYQWYWNSEEITGATDLDYTLSANTEPLGEPLGGGVYELSVVVIPAGGKKLSAQCRVLLEEVATP
jgi:uncharacterized repeat protein (TIGR02543 family)